LHTTTKINYKDLNEESKEIFKDDRKKKLICLVRLIGELYAIKVMNNKII